MSLERQKRHLKILELVSTRPLHTQDEVVEALNQEDWDVTQSSVSRDISALGLIKVEGIYQRPATATAHELADPNERRIAESLLAFDPAGDALVILHTPPGEAQRVGNALDILAWHEIVGTIAGDDTIFVATRNATAQTQLLGKLEQLLGDRSPG